MPAIVEESREPRGGATVSDVSATFWEMKSRLDDLRRKRDIDAFQHDARWMEQSARDIRDLESKLVDIETYAKQRGFWDVVQRARPHPAVVAPQGGGTSTWARPAATTAARVNEISYGSSSARPGYSPAPRVWNSSTSASSTGTDARLPVREVVKHTRGKASFRVWQEELPHTRSIGLLASEYSNADVDNFRDSHHGAGFRRTLTKVGWAGLALAIETAGIALSRRVMAGDIPFDFLPRRREEDDLDDED